MCTQVLVHASASSRKCWCAQILVGASAENSLVYNYPRLALIEQNQVKGSRDISMADQYARETASGLQNSAPDEQRWEASLSHPSLLVTENRSRAASQWVAENVRPERRYSRPTELGLQRKPLRRVRKQLASRYFQILSGHIVIGFFFSTRG